MLIIGCVQYIAGMNSITCRVRILDNNAHTRSSAHPITLTLETVLCNVCLKSSSKIPFKLNGAPYLPALISMLYKTFQKWLAQDFMVTMLDGEAERDCNTNEPKGEAKTNARTHERTFVGFSG